MEREEKLEVIFALIGLVGAMQNNEKTKNTDQVILDALIKASAEAVEKIHREKHQISPNCATCKMPCGNTDDYTRARYEALDEEIKALWTELIDLMTILAYKRLEKEDEVLERYMMKGIAYLGYDLVAESYKELIKEIQNTLEQ